MDKRSQPPSHMEMASSQLHNQDYDKETEKTPQLPLRPTQTLFQKFWEAGRPAVAEFLGVAIFVAIGAGSNCQAFARSLRAGGVPGDVLSTNLGWAIGLALGVWTTAGISGGHVNPAITLALATWRGFPWKKVPVYIFAQLLGGVVGTGLAYAQYIHIIDQAEGGRQFRTLKTAGLFPTFPLDYMTAVSSFFSEFLGAAILAFIIMATTDQHNAAPPLHLLPIVIFLVLLGLGLAFGIQTSFSFNPARDFGPRLFLTMAGYGGKLYTTANHYWIWGGILAPIAGAQVAVGLYDLCLLKSTTVRLGARIPPR
ncbi:aquaporin-like protein [Crepidotus variabilis]|uniref:Aquaporin-like protein n=1 Tax=Crepidotus variabilis TaxID=179855 RepID=A0A9P6EK72_9AGAR|nr:aquaporin-like protein [Crepidotus variabilis]